MALCLARSNPELLLAKKHSRSQDARIERVADAVEARSDFLVDIKNALSDCGDELQRLKSLAGQHKARDNVARATFAVLNMADTFDSLDFNESGTIDIAELRRGLHQLGMESHSNQADAIIERYTHDAQIDIKVGRASQQQHSTYHLSPLIAPSLPPCHTGLGDHRKASDDYTAVGGAEWLVGGEGRRAHRVSNVGRGEGRKVPCADVFGVRHGRFEVTACERACGRDGESEHDIAVVRAKYSCRHLS